MSTSFGALSFTSQGIVNHKHHGLVNFLCLDNFTIVYNKLREHEALLRAGDKSAARYLNEIDDKLTEQEKYTVKLSHVGLVDFFPDLRGYPVKSIG